MYTGVARKLSGTPFFRYLISQSDRLLPPLALQRLLPVLELHTNRSLQVPLTSVTAGSDHTHQYLPIPRSFCPKAPEVFPSLALLQIKHPCPKHARWVYSVSHRTGRHLAFMDTTTRISDLGRFTPYCCCARAPTPPHLAVGPESAQYPSANTGSTPVNTIWSSLSKMLPLVPFSVVQHPS